MSNTTAKTSGSRPPNRISSLIEKTRARVWLEGLAQLVCPRRCWLCGGFLDPGSGESTGFCEVCLDQMPPLPEACCRICGAPFETSLATRHVCSACRLRRPNFDRALAGRLYEDALRRAVYQYKYAGRSEMAPALAWILTSAASGWFHDLKADLVLPVPLHPRRLKERGFNQAQLLAARLFPDPNLVRSDILVRTRWTRPQVGLDRRARRRNVRGAFAVRRPELISERTVLVFDDVYTTGATADECARVLKRFGASRVLVLTLARVR